MRSRITSGTQRMDMMFSAITDSDSTNRANDTATTEIYTLSLHESSDLGGRRIIQHIAAPAHHAAVLVAVDRGAGAELDAELALLGRGDDADRVGAGQLGELEREHAEAAGRAPHEHLVAGLQGDLVHQHPVGGEVGEAVGGGLLPGEVLRLRQQLLRLDLAELGERAPRRLVAP